jgi:hypothetical protein
MPSVDDVVERFRNVVGALVADVVAPGRVVGRVEDADQIPVSLCFSR